MRYILMVVSILLMIGCEHSTVAPTATTKAPDHFVDSVNEHFYDIYSQDFEKAQVLMQEAIDLSVLNEWAEREAKSQHNYSVIQYMLGHYDRSLEAAFRARHLYDSLGNRSGLARISNELGNYYRKQGQLDKALEMWQTAEAMALASGDMEALGTSYGMRGTFFWLQKQYEISDEFYLKCYQIRLDEGDSVGLGYVLIDLADMEQRKGNLKAAIDYFDQSNRIRLAISDHQGLVDNYKMMGDLWMKEGRYGEAIPYYQQCAEHSKALQYPDLERKSYDSLASAFALTSEFQKAYSYKEKSDLLEDSLYSAEKAKIISELQTKYETAEKEKELLEKDLGLKKRNFLIMSMGIAGILMVILGAQLVQRQKLRHQRAMAIEQRLAKEAQIEAAISSQEKERSRFAKDLHDGFGQMISILNLNLKSLKDGGKDRHEVFESSSQVLEEMYQELKAICFNLMPQTLIKYGVPAALDEFAARINQTDKIRVETDFFGMEDRLTDVQEISLYRIGQEWVNNVIKYSDADKVTIQITRDEDEITLLIEDNGSGFDPELLKQGNGNGWKNMNSRANLINGVLELDTTPDMKGNTLIVNVRIKQYKNQIQAGNEALAE